MAKSPSRHIGASVRQRLLNLSRASGQSFDLMLTRYVLERLLYRLAQTPRAFRAQGRDAVDDLVRRPAPADSRCRFPRLRRSGAGRHAQCLPRGLCITEDDGVTFDPDALRVDRIRDALEYGGLRLRTLATIAGARVNVVVDIGFGDAIEPGLEELDLPVLLDLPSPRLRAYARETVIAEKFQAMVALGRANTRFKDFYDLWLLARTYSFDDDRLARAIRATFERRNTEIPRRAARRAHACVCGRSAEAPAMDRFRRRPCRRPASTQRRYR